MWRAERAVAGLVSLVGGLLKECSNFVQKTPRRNKFFQKNLLRSAFATLKRDYGGRSPHKIMQLFSPIEEITRINPFYLKKLKRMGIYTVRDLLFHFPSRYEDFSKLAPISSARAGEVFCFQGKIKKIENVRAWRKRMFITNAVVEDRTGEIKVVWFNQPYIATTLKENNFVHLAGKIALGKTGLYLSSPSYEKIGSMESEMLKKNFTHTGRLVPIYPETKKLSSKWLRFIIKPILEKIAKEIPDFLPEKIIRKEQLLPFPKALQQIHFPDSLKLAEEARNRFCFEELFLLSLFLLNEKRKLAKEKSMAIPANIEIVKDFVQKLPFKLTDSQKKTAWQILKNMEKDSPMNRLLEGDVGSGKTIVAAIAALNTAKAGFQTAFMVPTEILAKQHFENFKKMFKDFDLKIGLLTGKESRLNNRKLSKEKFLEKLKAKKNEVDILIGTHALIQEKVKFGNLCLVILDEQHRFGVKQRAELCQKKEFVPHLLSMTATPIPRTLSLTVYGDLDLSLISELPKGRKKIITRIVAQKDKNMAYEFVKEQVKSGRQVFVICPRIEIKEETKKNVYSNWDDVKAVKDEFKKLSEEIFPDLKIGMLHGKMPAEKKESVMKKFKDKKTDILVSTSVVEVGVDVPNASVMLIEGAERFGLAQLHQFRGRVGRAEHQSYCFLFTSLRGQENSRRLKALLTSEDGFSLAEKDLKIRGAGDFIGSRQSGIPDLAMASLGNVFLVEKAREAAKEILEEDSQLEKYPLLKEKIRQFHETIHLE
ncbi:MAG: ATP-dependent DNA helicase RecG [Candidatus Nealsonbacteria bacterium CG23_combo_of_CG06-09_8_20_14_all_39_17]|uniref:ATP-dependent DNA helicase RecG n=1 Tax=Candidatus Nealsonbacteria bacterium CG23_combo_of_CG06-09_8_20_14_all_39_17 TaxID=1974722 RepID=A0A2G9YUT1_9BACT|nr:MAG: ATP-dependent DNA helicase RecG [Candidatus Nealsonbacteria bacterium CG23_combo_of_CG06-09_8_20_14_all_39_17]